jgi:hypothetical protein
VTKKRRAAKANTSLPHVDLSTRHISRLVAGPRSDAYLNCVLLRGKCVGGPFSGKYRYDTGTICRIARDRYSKRIIIGYQGVASVDIEIGHYAYSDGEWIWHSPNPV